jgi:murein DD-endopeptidase MepM/ murein hydrolase activator NlpD
LIKNPNQIGRFSELRKWLLHKISTMRVLSFTLLMLAVLSSCAAPGTAATSTPVLPTVTIAPTNTATPLPTLTPTATPVPCDLATSDFCIVSGLQLFRRPIDGTTGNDFIDTTYLFGSTQNGLRKPHHGVEFPNETGTPVLAAYDGITYFAGDDATQIFGPVNNFYGNLVIIEHKLPDGQEIYTLYAHLSKLNAVVGQTVKAGDKIGEVGQTGWAIGSHLHFEVRFSPINYNSSVNPELWLLPHEGKGTAAIRLEFENGTRAWAPLEVKYYPDGNGSATQAWQPEMYPDELLTTYNWENYLVGELPPGNYHVQFLWRSAWVTREFTVEAGKVTKVEIRMK